jgi:cobalt-zinc-cadmium efflux system protein
MPEGNSDDSFLVDATDQLHEHFEITHVTLQVVKTPFSPSCVPPKDKGNATQAESAHDHHDCHGHSGAGAHAH